MASRREDQHKPLRSTCEAFTIPGLDDPAGTDISEIWIENILIWPITTNSPPLLPQLLPKPNRGYFTSFPNMIILYKIVHPEDLSKILEAPTVCSHRLSRSLPAIVLLIQLLFNYLFKNFTPHVKTLSFGENFKKPQVTPLWFKEFK